MVANKQGETEDRNQPMAQHRMESLIDTDTCRPPAGDIIALMDSWYTEAIRNGRNQGLQLGVGTPGIFSIDEEIGARYPWAVRLAQRFGIVRGLLISAIARRAPRVVCPMYSRGIGMFLLLEAMLGRGGRRVYLVEFIRPAPSGLLGHLKEWLHCSFCRLVFPRTLAALQVMTQWEIDAYARKYRLPRTLFHYIPFPMMLNPAGLPAQAPSQGAKVLCSGRAACDWETLFAAASGADWELTVVCSREDRRRVESLNASAGGRALVLSEVSAIRHEQLLRECDVYALVLWEQHASSGQVRLARAVEAGIPVVASSVRGLEGYLEDGVTGIAVAPGDAGALRQAIDALLRNPAARMRLRSVAYAALQPRTLACYIREIKAFCLQGAATMRS
jgi:hypothetical protein